MKSLATGSQTLLVSDGVAARILEYQTMLLRAGRTDYLEIPAHRGHERDLQDVHVDLSEPIEFSDAPTGLPEPVGSDEAADAIYATTGELYNDLNELEELAESRAKATS